MKRILIISLTIILPIFTMDKVRKEQQSNQNALTDFEVIHHPQPGGIDKLECYISIVGKKRFNFLLKYIEDNTDQFFDSKKGTVDIGVLKGIYDEGVAKTKDIKKDSAVLYGRLFQVEKFLSFQPPNGGKPVKLRLNDFYDFKKTILEICTHYYPEVNLTDELYTFLFQEINRRLDIEPTDEEKKDFDFLDVLRFYNEQRSNLDGQK